MCGIAGIIVKNKLPESVFDKYLESSRLLNHRGPDFTDHYRFENVMIIHYRLSIIDLDARSHQPYHSRSRDNCCVYNGEIYNFNQLRSTYDIQTKTTSDTEVMLESFEKIGVEAVKEWNGIFSIGILNQSARKISLIRDRFGVKPMYYYEDDDVFLFASEAKVIFDWLPSFNLNYDGISQYLWYGNTTTSQTMVDKVKKLEPATILEINLDTFKKESTKFWSIAGTKPTTKKIDTHVSNIKTLLTNAVERQLIADVPIGILLSGGIDSSAIVGLASQHSGSKLDTYSVEYDYNAGGKSELKLAAMVAKKYNTNHHELKITSKNIPDLFSKLVFQYDEPFFDPASIPLYQLAKATSHDKKVILQGDGGDELFAGYRRYNIADWLGFWKYGAKILHALSFSSNASIRNRLKRMSYIVNEKDDGLRMAYFLSLDVPYKNPINVMSSESYDKLIKCNPFKPYQLLNEKYKNEDLVQKLLYADVEILLANTYLEKVDKATMLNSVESRVPFLDNELTEYVFSLPSSLKVRYGSKKFLLKKAVKGIVPDEILNGKKRGFDVPFRTWLKTDLYDFAHAIFEEIPFTNLIDKTKLLHLLDEHKKGTADNGAILWKMLVFTTWLTRYKDKINF